MAQGLLHVCSDHEESIQEFIIYIRHLRVVQCLFIYKKANKRDKKKPTDANAAFVTDRLKRVREQRERG